MCTDALYSAVEPAIIPVAHHDATMTSVNGSHAQYAHAGDLYDEVEPATILDARKGDGPKKREFLVKFSDGHEDCWVLEKDMAQDLIDDYDASRELAEAEDIIEQRLRGDTIDYLIR